MAAPAGLSSGAAPEPAAQAADPQAAAPELAAAVPAQAPEPTLPAADGQAPAAAEPAAAMAEPNAAEVPGPGLEPTDAEPAEPAEKARRASPLAVVAVIVGTIVLVGAAAAVLAGVTHGFRPKTVVTYREAAVFSLRAGQCIDSSPNGLSVTIRSCGTPHDAEVFATFRLPGAPWPGGAAVQVAASNGCVARVGAYLNPQFANAGFTQEYVFPNREAWQAGVRTVVCEIRASSGQLTGSVRQAAS
jgi:Septum formation